MADPIISVVTPSFNQAQYLEATIQSILRQGYPQLDYVIMDGGSTDGSVEIIRRYQDRLAFWVSEPDGGQADAVNKGWQRAKGDILAYLNSDDLYLPGAFQRVVECFAQHPDVELVYGSLQLINDQGHALGKPVQVPEISLSWLLRYPLPQPTMFVRRSVIERIGLFDEALYYVFDWDFCLRVAIAGVHMARISGPPLAAFRSWGSQKTANGFERQINEQLRIRDCILSRPDLSTKVAGEVRFSKAWAYLWPAYQYYIQGELRPARELLHRALGTDRHIALHPDFMGLYARTFLGRRISQLARRAKARLTG